MSTHDNSPTMLGIPSNPNEDVATLLGRLREVARECRAEDPCLLMTGFFEHMNMPAWIKVVQGDELVMVHINRAYKRATDIEPAEYILQPDSAVWMPTDAAQFERDDWICIRERRSVPIRGELAHPFRPELIIEYAGWKWPIMVDGEAVAVCGMAHMGWGAKK